MKTKNLRTGTSLTPFYREKNRYKEIKDPCEKELGRGVAGLPKCPVSVLPHSTTHAQQSRKLRFSSHREDTRQ